MAFNYTPAVRKAINKAVRGELDLSPRYDDPVNLSLRATGGWWVHFSLKNPKIRKSENSKVTISYYPLRDNIWESGINEDIVADIATILEANITARPLTTHHSPPTAERLAGMDYKSILNLHTNLVAEGKIQKHKGMKRDRNSLIHRILNAA